jgi:hypothetical protein
VKPPRRTSILQLGDFVASLVTSGSTGRMVFCSWQS